MLHTIHVGIFVSVCYNLPIVPSVNCQVIMYIAFIAKFGCPDSSKFLGSERQVAGYGIQTTSHTGTCKTVYGDGREDVKDVKTFDTYELKRVR